MHEELSGGPEPEANEAEVASSFYEATQLPSTVPSRHRAIAAVVATVVIVGGVAVAVTQAGSSKGTPVTNAQLLQLIHSAPGALQRAPASTFRMTMTMSAEGHHESLLMSGVSDNRTRASTFSMTGPGVSAGAISLARIGYFEVPADKIQLNHGKPWLGVHTLKPTAEQRQLIDQGPAGMLKALNQVGGTIENDGSDEVGGVQTTKYSFHADLLRLFGSLYSKIFGPGIVPKLRSAGLGSVPTTLWLDRNNLPREMTLSFHIGPLTMNEVTYITPTNVIPKISAPPATQVRMAKSVRQYELILREIVGAQSSSSA